MTDRIDRPLEEVIERYESGQPARDATEQAEFDHLAACADEPEDPQGDGNWPPGTSWGEREAREASDAEAWGGRGPSASYAEWAAEGHEESGPQLPGPGDLYRAREQVLEIGQGGGSPAEVAQAGLSAQQTEAAYIQADQRHWERDPAYRAEVVASYDGDRCPGLEAGQ